MAKDPKTGLTPKQEAAEYAKKPEELEYRLEQALAQINALNAVAAMQNESMGELVELYNTVAKLANEYREIAFQGHGEDMFPILLGRAIGDALRKADKPINGSPPRGISG